MASSVPRRTHRKRGSVLHLSSDTTATLPEYITVGGWHREHDLHSDSPPDYPDSAEEADEDTDAENDPSSIYLPPPPPLLTPLLLHTPSPRKARKFVSHRRKKSQVVGPNQNLDSLLARSVHALEMSNTLLQSSMATQSSFSTIFAADSPVDQTLEARARGLSMRIHSAEATRTTWAEDLDEITRGVEGLFEDEGGGFNIPNRRAGPSSYSEPSISRSLPITSPLSRTPAQRQPSVLDPRSDANFITLPSSSLGLLTGSSTHLPFEGSQLDLHGLPLSPRLTDRPLEPSTPAYNMLASFVTRKSSSGPSPPFLQRSFLPRRRHSLNTSPPGRRRPFQSQNSLESVKANGPTSTSSPTPKQFISSLPQRAMTPPSEESSGLSDGCPAKLTVLSLRKILDDQPPPTPPEPPDRFLRPPAFLPRTPATLAEAGTSTTTASVSRLFTKSKHSSSTRSPSPPRHSALKQSSPGISPSPSTSTIPDLLGAGVEAIRAWGGGGSGNISSAPGSGRSTPKRISFAELPESYAGSKSGGSSSRFRDLQQKKNKKRRKGKGKDKEGSGESESDVGWWSGWLVGTGAIMRQEEKMEDRLTRHYWGGRMAGAGFDDWPV